MNPILYDRSELRRRGIKLSNSTLLRLEASDQFPKRVRVGAHTVAWLGVEIDAHISKLVEARHNV